MRGMSPALAALGVSVVVAGAAFAGPIVLGLALLFVLFFFVQGWYGLSGTPPQKGDTVVAFLAGAVAIVGVLRASVDDPSLSPVLVVLGLLPVVTLARVVWLARLLTVMSGVVAVLMVTLAGSVLAALSAGLVAERTATMGREVTMTAVLAAGVAAAAGALRLSDTATDVLAVLLGGVGVGAAAGYLVPELGTTRAVILACFAAVFALAARRIAAPEVVTLPDPPAQPAGIRAVLERPGGRVARREAARAATRAAHRRTEAVRLAGATLPVLLAAPGTYILGRLLVG